ncbi:MAG: DUF262 domain-containing protein [Kiritimatiellae bacterium]|nr:DUF262 domain-containing protein [Kiritimatiellia bacterium]
MGITANIKTTRDILSQNLRIPDYQRPYRWTTANVLQLLEDIKCSQAEGKPEYRIGTVIFYGGADQQLEIVDGQQRLTTILLIAHVAGKGGNPAESTIIYPANSVSAIRENHKFIEGWIADNTNDNGASLADYILENCRFMEIVVDDLSEAFQMFDTQNGRGKSLEAYNLLKAYHIRAMEQNTQEERIQCDRDWEGATQYDATPDVQNDPNVDILGQLFREQLFKSRLWCRNDVAKDFTKDDIGEFKGFTIDKNHPIDFPFQNPFLLQYLTEKFYRNVLSGAIGTKTRFESGETDKANPFVNIGQTIINGKSFFEYVGTYVELYKKMFVELGSYQLAEFKEFFYLHCLTYNPQKTVWEQAKHRTDSFRDTDYQSRRTGDTYLREAYKSVCFVLLDKFGEKTFLKYYKLLYRLIYQVRLQTYAVKYPTAMSAPKTYFAIIQRAKSESDLLQLDKLAAGLKAKRFDYSGKMPEPLRNFIIQG